MKKLIISVSALVMPFVVFAKADLDNVIKVLKTAANAIVPLLMVIAVAVFLWGIVKYITAAGDESKQKTAKSYIIYGLIGIFVMVAFFGIIQLVISTFGIETGVVAPPVINF